MTPSRDLTDVTLVSEDHDGPDDHDGMMKMKIKMKMEMKMKMKMIKFDDDVGYLVMKVIQSSNLSIDESCPLMKVVYW